MIDEQTVMKGQEFPNPSRPIRNAAFLPMREATRVSCGGFVNYDTLYNKKMKGCN